MVWKISVIASGTGNVVLGAAPETRMAQQRVLTTAAPPPCVPPPFTGLAAPGGATDRAGNGLATYASTLSIAIGVKRPRSSDAASPHIR